MVFQLSKASFIYQSASSNSHRFRNAQRLTCNEKIHDFTFDWRNIRKTEIPCRGISCKEGRLRASVARNEGILPGNKIVSRLPSRSLRVRNEMLGKKKKKKKKKKRNGRKRKKKKESHETAFTKMCRAQAAHIARRHGHSFRLASLSLSISLSLSLSCSCPLVSRTSLSFRPAATSPLPSGGSPFSVSLSPSSSLPLSRARLYAFFSLI